MKNKTALLIVDVTNDFTDPKGALYVKDGEKTVENINKLIDAPFDYIVMIHEIHPKDHKWFASNHEGKNPFETTQIFGNTEVLWPDHVVQNTWGAEIFPALKDKLVSLENGYFVFHKGLNPDIHPYSPFQDPDSGIEAWLKVYTDDVVVVGLATDYCVKETAIDACLAGLNTFVVSDAIAAVNINPNDGVDAIEQMESAGCEVKTTDDIIKNL